MGKQVRSATLARRSSRAATAEASGEVKETITTRSEKAIILIFRSSFDVSFEKLVNITSRV